MTVGHPSDVVVGRESERDALLALVSGAVAGEGAATVLTGPPGIGKTAVLDQVATLVRSDGLPVVHVIGTGAESGWPYAGVNLVFSAAVGVFASHGGGRVDTEPFVPVAETVPSAYAVALRAQRLVDRIESPVLIVIDDAHLLDPQSREVIGFAARRLQSVPVALVMSGSEASLGGPPFVGLPKLRLSDLAPDDAVDLVRRAGGGEITDDVTRRIVTGAGGYPAALLDVVDELSDDQRLGLADVGRYLPHSPRMRAAVLPDLATYDEARRFALLTAAVNEDGQFAPLMAALEGLSDDVLTWLVHRHITLLDGSFTFRTPAVRSVIWHASSLDDRSRAHRALADAYAGSDPEYELWHRAQATHDYDDALAADLHRLAGEVRSRGELSRSVAYARQSVRLASDSVDRVERLVLSSQLALHAGRLGDATRFARERLRFATTPEQRADLALLEAQASNLYDGYVAVGLIEGHAHDVAPVDPHRAARLYLLGARQLAERKEIAEARRFVAAAQRYRADFDRTTLGFFLGVRGWLAAMAGEPDPAVPLQEAITAADDGDIDAAYLSICRAQVLVHTERYDDARAILNLIVRDRWYGASPVLLASASGVLADLESRAGRLVAAAEAAEVAERVIGREWSGTGRIAAGLVRTHALLGDVDQAWARRDQALSSAQRTGERATTALAQAGAGLQLLLLDRLDEAVAVLQRARHHALEYANPALLMSDPDLVEACARAGEQNLAQTYLQEFESRARKSPSAWARAALARCRAIVADGPDSLPLFREAIDLCASCASPIELGRALLAYGERLRRLGRRAEARAWLDQAIVIFGECSAAAMTARAERELRAVGPGSNSSGHDPELTSAELRVASMAASGMRNREIAHELYVSTRTVEGHLSQVFRKLGIRSRTELAGVFRRPDVD